VIALLAHSAIDRAARMVGAPLPPKRIRPWRRAQETGRAFSARLAARAAGRCTVVGCGALLDAAEGHTWCADCLAARRVKDGEKRRVHRGRPRGRLALGGSGG
jgi:hypothetical protein